MVEATVPGLLASRAQETPDRTAIGVAGGDTLTFGEWERRSSEAASGLGIRQGERVGLLFDEREWVDYAVAFCAVLRAGGVAVPLCARTPPAQLREMLLACSAAGLVHGHDVEVPPETGWAKRIDALPGAPVTVRIGPDEPAQILFTSGTTGSPKGVCASHANLAFGYHPGMRRRPLAHSSLFMHSFPMGTNAAQMMLLNALIAEPAALVLPRFDSGEFCALIEERRVGTVFVVPAMAIDLINSGALARHDTSSVVLFGSTAAALPPAVAAELAKALPRADIVNYYSSTEAMPAQTVMIFDPERPGALGQPTPDDLMICDEDGVPLPAGETGEVWLSSPTAQRSYYGDASANRRVFRDGWTRMGDLGYLDAEGYLYLVDRESDIVKSGAHKVSTLRVEAALHEHPGVAEAAALGLPHPVMGSVLAAAVVARQRLGAAGAQRRSCDQRLGAEELKEFLRQRLAQHEMPARIEVVESLPRNEAGKVLKHRLREWLAAATGGPAAATPTEKALAGLWARVLDLREASGDFFACGGDSFTATRLAALVTEELGVAAPVSFVFDHPSLAAQAKWVEAQPPVRTVERFETAQGVPLSALQEYFLRWMDETEPPRAVSAVATAIRITDKLDVASLRLALNHLAERHDALRTVFTGRSARLLDRCPPEFVQLDAVSADEARRLACQALERPFDLAEGPLCRAALIRLAPEDHVFVLGVHHLVCDGWSMGILLKELATVYDGQPHRLGALPLRAADVSARARARWPASRAFWQRVLEGAPAALRGVERKRAGRFTGTSLPLVVPQELAARVRATASTHGVTAYMALLAVWGEVLSAWSGSPEIVVMSPVPGRTRGEFDGVVGCLVQSLLLRIEVAAHAGSWQGLLEHVREVVLAATEHQYYPYEEFAVRIPHPAWFRFESWEGPAHLRGLLSGPFELPRELMFDWPLPEGLPDLSVPELALTEQPDGSMSGWLVYNRRCFDEAAVDGLGREFLRRWEEHV